MCLYAQLKKNIKKLDMHNLSQRPRCMYDLFTHQKAAKYSDTRPANDNVLPKIVCLGPVAY